MATKDVPHWYSFRDGVAVRYFQRNKDGSESKIIRRERAVEDGAVEGLTAILGRAFDQAALIGWSGKLGIEAGIKATKDMVMAVIAAGKDAPSSEAIDAQVQAAAKELYDSARDKAANRGSEFHDAIERHLATGEWADDPILKVAQGEAEAWLHEHGIIERRVEHCLIFRGDLYGHPVAWGGTTDVICEGAIVDWKSVAEAKGRFYTKKPSHCAQVSGYALAAIQMGLCAPDPDLWNVYFDRETGAIIDTVQWSADQIRCGEELIALAIRSDELQAMIKEQGKQKENGRSGA